MRVSKQYFGALEERIRELEERLQYFENEGIETKVLQSPTFEGADYLIRKYGRKGWVCREFSHMNNDFFVNYQIVLQRQKGF